MENKINLPKGYKFLGKNVGIKFKNYDFGILYSEKLCQAAAMFTKSSICGVSIPIGRKNILNGQLQSIVVTSGIANVATGEQGKNNTLSIIKKVANELDVSVDNVLPSSTGVIGQQLPVDKIISGIKNIKTGLSEDYKKFAKAIMTTDKKIKVKSAVVGNSCIMGIAKGSGMIEPNMATMLVYFITDAKIIHEELDRILKNAINLSFNMISIDTDTSTSDTVVLMANGESGEVNITEFESHFIDLCIDLAKEIIKDAEGATKLIEVNVNGASSFEQAKKVAKSIVNSPLVKTAVYGSDPNWGRIIMAIGKVGDNTINDSTVSIKIGGHSIYDKGKIYKRSDNVIEKYFKNSDEIIIDVDLHLSNCKATVWGCDLTEEYVEINSQYTT